MGVIAESIVEYAQPLIDKTDGSQSQVSRALSIAQVCWNLALLPENDREACLAEIRPALEMDDAEFEGFRQSVVAPMIRRHHEMFPSMPQLNPQVPAPPSPERKYPGTGRNQPCPCNSGKKYKRCCGQ